jgi:hypothetical protein
LQIFKKSSGRRDKGKVGQPNKVSVERLFGVYDILTSLHSSAPLTHSMEVLATIRSLKEQRLIEFNGADGFTQKVVCLIDVDLFRKLCEDLEISVSDYFID